MVLLKFATFLICYILATFVFDYPVEGVIINQNCSLGEWHCDNGECISFDMRCDGDIDCTDKSDEAVEYCSADNSRAQKCILPPYPDYGSYNTTIMLKPGDPVFGINLAYTCDEGYHLSGEPFHLCVMGIWLTEQPTCERQCQPLKSTSVDFKCYKPHSRSEVSCELPQDNNSRVKATCKDLYYLEPPPKYLICIKGNWDYMPQCTPECGTVASKDDTPFISQETKIGEFPWHVGLYDKTSRDTRQLCSGNIVSPTLVVTAAHCVYKENVGLYPASKFAVAAGKIYRNWNAPEDEKSVQKIDVVKIEIPERYRGSINSFMADIAVLILEKSFVLRSFIRPVCIPSDSNDNLNGQLGKVTGWGLTAENGNFSQILQTVRLPLISFPECFENSPESFRPLITLDKICAGYITGTALCNGDSGGGLVFSRWKRNQDIHYLHGIVSNSPRNEAKTSCSALSYSGFTDLKMHQEWLRNILSKYNTIG